MLKHYRSAVMIDGVYYTFVPELSTLTTACGTEPRHQQGVTNKEKNIKE
jgi:hypothetical protein